MKFLILTLLIIIAVIAYLSITPVETISIGNDKVGHFIAYASLMINLGLLTYSNRKKYMLVIVLALFYGGSLEIIQHYVPGRFMSIYDMLANSGGVLLGVLIINFFYKKMKLLLEKVGIKLH